METEKSLFDEFMKGGWIIPFVGAAAMTARLLSTDDHGYSWVEQIKKVITAAIASSITWVILDSGVVLGNEDHSSQYQLAKAIAYGVVGVISPEIIGGIIKVGKRFSRDPASFLKF
jgi:hypothetical protein